MNIVADTDTCSNIMMASWSRLAAQGHSHPAVVFPSPLESRSHLALPQYSVASSQHRPSLIDHTMDPDYSFSYAPVLLPRYHQTQPQAQQWHAQTMAHPTRNPQAQDQQFQDEIEQLMMGTEVVPTTEFSTVTPWSDGMLSPGARLYSQSSLDETHCFSDQKFEINAPNLTGPRLEWLDRNNQVCQHISTFATEVQNQGTSKYALSSFGSYSDRSDLGGSFSPASPQDFSFDNQPETLHIRSNSDDQYLGWNGLPAAENNTIDTTRWKETSTPLDCLASHHQLRNKHENATLAVQPNLVFPQAYPTLHSQNSLSTIASASEATGFIFGSRDYDEEFVPWDPPDLTASNGISLSRSMPAASGGRIAKDEFLVKMRLGGHPYREIKKAGRFPEAESTLRGRYRTLTKTKDERVRKPHWQAEDLRLLEKAVHTMVGSGKARRAKMPEDIDRLNVQWKEVAAYIASHGGSYHFGNATCKKKWQEIQNLRRR